ncbi:TPA: hypothetical protein N0F65_008166 [Lagenidium giganteum]|uniref:Uncharacterized protein n=1 Tax=Lagenidium giganteum TaxID=4803 RepID=A0AAV2YP38_9STRA|nr:TPA: hypothetical protein N0F65_008166 [Lagenidium giganteum]
MDSDSIADGNAHEANGALDNEELVVAEDHVVHLSSELFEFIEMMKSTQEVEYEPFRLDMRGMTMPPRLWTALEQYLCALSTPLVRLSLSGTYVGPEGAMTIGKALVTNNCLQVLELDNCELVGSAYRPVYSGLKSLVKGIESPRSELRYLNLARNDLLPEGSRIILGVAAFHARLTALDISNTMLSIFNEDDGVIALSYIFRFTHALCWIDFSGNLIPSPCLRVLRTALGKNKTLTSIQARDCGLQHSDLFADNPLNKSSVVQTLDLSSSAKNTRSARRQQRQPPPIATS